MSRRHPERRSDADLIKNYQGLMLAFCLSERAVMLLLGCSREEAAAFQNNARGEFEGLRIRIAQARRGST